MVRLIDIDDTSLLKTIGAGRLSAKAVWRLIKAQPTVDAVPVIRCKDCYFYGTFQRKHYCTKYDHTVKQDDYCAWAEPKEKDNDRADL